MYALDFFLIGWMDDWMQILGEFPNEKYHAQEPEIHKDYSGLYYELLAAKTSQTPKGICKTNSGEDLLHNV